MGRKTLKHKQNSALCIVLGYIYEELFFYFFIFYTFVAHICRPNLVQYDRIYK